ncbi:Cdc6: ORC1-type DNA replication protein [Desulfosarcina variabilis str. Montpellier]|uniref:Cdc6/Cdc18 family protein n=1 Tax=Desulfosarcina variabilis TaxID=2300 RepID=UPI003AFB1292
MNLILDSTEILIESLHAARKDRTILIRPDFLDDEKLPEEERIAVLNQIFNQKIRQKQLSRIIAHLTPVLDRSHPPSALIYGPTGSGKTVSLIHVLSKFSEAAARRGIGFKYVYIDLTSPKTYFGALNEAAIALNESNRRYRKGIPVEYMQAKIKDAIKKSSDYLCLLIDEVDNIRPNPDGFLTFFGKTLPRKVDCRLILIMLTNRLDWEKTLDPRILSFLKKSDIIFEPYDALDLLEILKLRAKKALKTDKIDPAALNKIAAYASRETGDARKAVELLTKAVQVAEDSSGYLGLDEVDIAEHRLEVDKTIELIQVLAVQQRLALQACYCLLRNGSIKITTGQSYETYRSLCEIQNYRPLTQRRFCDMISFLDLYGLINARVVSMGRYGKTREIMGALPNQVIDRLLSTGRSP